MKWLDGSVYMSLSKLWEMVKDREAWHTASHKVTKSWTQLSDWTATTKEKVPNDLPLTLEAEMEDVK